jgi:DNA repair protein RadC
MITPQQVTQAFVENDLETMMDAVRIVASRLPQPAVIQHPAMYATHVMHDLGFRDREEFWLTTLNGGGEIIETHRLYVGTVYTAVMRLPEIMKVVIEDDAVSFIVAHNHPNSQSRIAPSPQDITTTRKIYQVARYLGIPLMDHIIVSQGQWFSFREHDLLEERNVQSNEVQRPPRLPRANTPGPERAARGQG